MVPHTRVLLHSTRKPKRLTFVVNGVSKAYSMTGWRIGYTAGPEDAISAMSRIQSHSTSNPTSIAQKGAIAALKEPQDAVEEMRKAFEERRDVICQRFDEIDGVSYMSNRKVRFISFLIFLNITEGHSTVKRLKAQWI